MIPVRRQACMEARISHGRSGRLALGVATGVITKAFSFALTLIHKNGGRSPLPWV